MDCREWKERLIESVYGELAPENRRGLDDHLAVCPDCRRALDDLEDARGLLRLGEPEIPAAPRVVVLPSPRAAWNGWIGFAAGIACSVLFLAVGLAIGMRWPSSVQDTATVHPATIPADVLPQDLVYRSDLETMFRDHAASLDDFRQAVPSRAYIDNRLGDLERLVNQKRQEDLQRVMEEILASELRSGYAIDETQQTLRYLTLAGDPGLSEW